VSKSFSEPGKSDYGGMTMSNARTEVAEVGWEVYRTSVPRPSLEEVNAALDSAGLEQVSPRMLRHYKKLDRFDLQKYLPINELDTRAKRHANGPANPDQS
jgi:hypothetical protein